MTRWAVVPVVLLVGAGLAPAVTAAEVRPCAMAGPAGTASVLRVDLPHGSPSLALRVTTPTRLADVSPQSVGNGGGWHLATQVALLRVGTGALVASRVVQVGSSPRAAVVAAGGQQVRAALPAAVAPFRHVGAVAPDHLGPGRYLLVAYGTDGSPALPNPGWSAEASFGVPVMCVPLRVGVTVLDRDQSAFTGGTQVTGYGAGTGTGATSWQSRSRYAVGFVDAATQLAGDATARGTLPGGARVEVRNALRGFASGRGSYRFTAGWTGAFPLVLVCAIAFTT